MGCEAPLDEIVDGVAALQIIAALAGCVALKRLATVFRAVHTELSVSHLVLSPAQWQELAEGVGLGPVGLDSIYCGECSGLKKFGQHCPACFEEIEQ